MRKPDKETRKILKKGELLSSLVQHEAWPLVKVKFNEMVLSLGDIFSLNELDPQKLQSQLAARQIAIEMVMNWMREIEGITKQHETNSVNYTKMRRDAYLVNSED